MIDLLKSPEENLQRLLKFLKRGTVDYKFPFRYLTLTTTEADSGVPTARMLVLRHINEKGQFVLFSDIRSEKIAALRANQQAHLMFWHPRKQVQIGVHAKIRVHHQDERSRAYMENVSTHARQQYTSVRPPSAPIDNPRADQQFDDELFEANFCVLAAAPWRITALQLKREGHLRLRFDMKGGSWEGGWITP